MQKGDINLFVVGFAGAFAIDSAIDGRVWVTLVEYFIAGVNLVAYLHARSKPSS